MLRSSRFGSGCVLSLALFCSPALALPGAVLNIAGPASASGAAGEILQIPLTMTLTTLPDGSNAGAQGWSISVATEGANIVSASLADTDAAALFNNGFNIVHLTDGVGNEGVVSAVVLSFTTPVTLPPSGTASILNATLEGIVPQTAGVWRVIYQNGLQGPGQPVTNTVTYLGTSVTPQLGELQIEVTPGVPSQIEWISPSSGGWNVGANWSTGVAPAASQSVIIQPANGLTVNGPAASTTIRSLSIGAQSTGVATLGGFSELIVSEHLEVQSGGKLAVSGVLTVNGGDSALSNAGEIQLTSSGEVNGPAHVLNSGTIHGTGEIKSDVTNTQSGLIRATAGQSLVLSGETAPNAGRIAVQGGLIDFVNGLENQPGTGAVVEINGGRLISHTLRIEDGDFDWSSGSLHTRTFFGDLENVAGTLAPGRPGTADTTSILGDYTQLGASAAVEIEIGGFSPGTQYDVVVVEDDALLVGGDLRLSLINGFTPNAFQQFTVLEADTIFGTFDNVENGERLQTVDGRGSFLVHYGAASQLTPNRVILTSFEAIAGLGGDYNNDGTVNAADYVVWRNHAGTNFPLPNRELGATGNIDDDDYQFWVANFGNSVGSGTTIRVSTDSVPEPTTLGLMTVTLLLLITRVTPRSRPAVSTQ